MGSRFGSTNLDSVIGFTERVSFLRRDKMHYNPCPSFPLLVISTALTAVTPEDHLGDISSLVQGPLGEAARGVIY